MLRLWTHGNFSHFASGFLLGISIALLIRGLAQPSRRISRWTLALGERRIL